jgi:protein gp37
VDKARPRVFCGSMCDVFEDRNDLHEPRARLIRLIDATPHLDWLLLTKRAEKVMSILCTMAHSLNDGMAAWWRYVEGFPKNVWLGVSCSTQEDVDRNVPHLLRIPAAVRFLSLEPLLEAIELPGGLRGEEVCPECGGDAGANSDGTWQCVAIVDGNLGCGWRGEEATSAPSIDWVIVGGESGPRARPCHVDWIRSVMAQCTAACVARFVKQLGFDVRGNYDDFQYLTQTSHLLGMGDFHDGAGDSHVIRLGDARGGRPDEWPADLQVREFPSVRAKR